LIDLVACEVPPPPIHFVTGRRTSLGELARITAAMGNTGSALIEGIKRSYGVDHFVGDPSRARELLGWRSTTSIEQTIDGMIKSFRHAIAVKPELCYRQGQSEHHQSEDERTASGSISPNANRRVCQHDC
jgi:hypothetical protein